MSVSNSMGQSRSRSKNSSTQRSDPLSPDKVAAFFSKIDSLSDGRLNKFATQGTQALTPEQLKAVGGAGASRELQVRQARQNAVSRINSDPRLTLSQRQRAQQQTDSESSDRLDAIKKETEAALTGIAQDNNKLPREDMALLAQIFFGGKGQTSRGRSQGMSKASAWNQAGSFGIGGS